MRLTKHRGTFNLEMSSEEINNLCFVLRGYQTAVNLLGDEVSAPNLRALLEEYLHELTVYQREAYAYDQYLEKEET